MAILGGRLDLEKPVGTARKDRQGRSTASGRSCFILVEYIEAWPLTETQKIAKKLLPRDRTDNEVDLEG